MRPSDAFGRRGGATTIRSRFPKEASPAQPASRPADPLVKNLPWLYLGRGIRSLATAFLTVIFPLYLARSGYSATEVGLVVSVSGVMTMLLVAAVGLLADRYGRRNMILVLSLLSLLGSVTLAALPALFWPIALASGLGGVGRGGGAGSGGSWGPVFPAEQPLIAASSAGNRTRAFGRLSFIGVMAGAFGSLVASFPAAFASRGGSLIEGYHLLFWASAVLSIGMVGSAFPIQEPSHVPTEQDSPPPIPVRTLVGRLGLTNALNGFGFGFLGPLLTYWFYRRYGVGPAEIGIMYAVVNVATALPYLLSHRLAERLGSVRTVVVTRATGLVMLAAMPFMPTFAAAGLFYTLRMVMNSLGMPARQSFTMGAAEDRYRSRVAAFSSLPSQITAMLSPAIGGVLMETALSLPLFAAALFMGLNVVTYHLAFHKVAERE